MTRPISNRLVFQDTSTQTGLGRISLAGHLTNTTGRPAHSMRVLGSYALVYLIAGQGTIEIPGGDELPILPGTFLLLVPEQPHRYGPKPNQTWEEFYVVFEGRLFDQWRKVGALPRKHTLYPGRPSRLWLKRLQATLGSPGTPRELRATQQCCLVESLVVELESSRRLHLVEQQDRLWLHHAMGQINGVPPGQVPDWIAIARKTGCGYELFRKRFRALAGMAPGQFRARRVIELAAELISSQGMSIRAVPRQLGFANEFHFSRRFKDITGYSPSEFRSKIPG